MRKFTFFTPTGARPGNRLKDQADRWPERRAFRGRIDRFTQRPTAMTSRSATARSHPAAEGSGSTLVASDRARFAKDPPRARPDPTAIPS
jgi:hypothetical protein